MCRGCACIAVQRRGTQCPASCPCAAPKDRLVNLSVCPLLDDVLHAPHAQGHTPRLAPGNWAPQQRNVSRVVAMRSSIHATIRDVAQPKHSQQPPRRPPPGQLQLPPPPCRCRGMSRCRWEQRRTHKCRAGVLAAPQSRAVGGGASAGGGAGNDLPCRFGGPPGLARPLGQRGQGAGGPGSPGQPARNSPAGPRGSVSHASMWGGLSRPQANAECRSHRPCPSAEGGLLRAG